MDPYRDILTEPVKPQVFAKKTSIDLPMWYIDETEEKVEEFSYPYKVLLTKLKAMRQVELTEEYYRDCIIKLRNMAFIKPTRITKATEKITTKAKYVRIKRQTYATARYVWFNYYKMEPLFVMDHINRDRTDNRIQNLRDVPQKMNVKNKNNDYKSKILFSRYFDLDEVTMYLHKLYYTELDLEKTNMLYSTSM